MANVINRTTYEYLESVNTPDYSEVDWLHDPDVSALESVERKYWKVVDDEVLEMSQAEKDAVDAAIYAAQLAAAVSEAKDLVDAAQKWKGVFERAYRALVMVTLSEINILRVEAGLSERTVAQVKAAIKAQIDGEG